MINFLIILFLFYILFLFISLTTIDSMVLFIVIFLGFLIALICLIIYLGKLRGIITALLLIIAPFLLEYFFYKLKLPLFESALIRNLTFKRLDLPITIRNLYAIFNIPLLFISALIFSQKIKLFANIKKYHKTFIIIISSLLLACNFLFNETNLLNYKNLLKWLIIALLVYGLASYFYKFKIATPEIYKELPIIMFLALAGYVGLIQRNLITLTINILLILLYILILYNEYKVRKISQT